MASKADIGVLDTRIVFMPRPWHPYAYYDGERQYLSHLLTYL